METNISETTNNRFKKIALSSTSAIILKILTFVCSFILTRLIIKTYGSETNGMIGSITQFIGFIALLEGGIGGVARAALYKPLAEKNHDQLNKIINYVQRFFRILALCFVVYALTIAFIYPVFANNFDYWFTFSLVIILSLSSFCEYFFGLTYTILINSDQKNFIGNYLTFAITLLSFFLSLLLIKFNCSILFVKLCCAAVLMLKPLFLFLYCRKKYLLSKTKVDKKENVLPHKWSGFGVHVAYYLHRNTDMILITIFLSLSQASIYSVYNLIIGGILTIIDSLSLGIEAAFGDMYVRKEFESLTSKFKMFVLYYQIICTVLLSSTIILIIPFIRLYTAGITDVDYINPSFAILFVLAEFIYCLRVPYNNLMVATDSFKSVRFGAYIEAALNIVISASLINILGLYGVAIGTICAMTFRLVHFLVFFKKNELRLQIKWFVQVTLLSVIVLLCSIIFGVFFSFSYSLSGYGFWVLFAFACVLITTILACGLYLVFYKKGFIELLCYLKQKLHIFSKKK